MVEGVDAWGVVAAVAVMGAATAMMIVAATAASMSDIPAQAAGTVKDGPVVGAVEWGRSGLPI